MTSLVCPPDISPLRARWATRDRSDVLNVSLTEAERQGLFSYGYIDSKGRVTREGSAFAGADDFQIAAAQARWRKAFGAAA